ncbi:baseplate J/gp47 family protein [Longimicrobium sp.]|uniref:baseplate J/gp47 family protein n=1 Tax=Longimicrobium sp. TaxID=2029185 RepID=UPI003B3A8630
MPLTIPRIDDRDYPRILNEALARIPVHNPEWTNFNDADPGVTLLQLFAFMTDSLLYRANLIPERNRLKFLELLGIPLRPPAAATGVAAIANERGPLETVTLPRELQLFSGPVGFVTRNALDVLPVEGRVFYRAPLLPGTEEQTAQRIYTQLYGDGDEDAAALDFYRTTPFDPPVNGARIGAVSLTGDAVDRALWLALLVRPSDMNAGGQGSPPVDPRDVVRAAIAGKTLTLGFVPAWDGKQRVLRPGGAPPRQLPTLSFDISTGRFSGDTPVYLRLDAAADDDALENLTLVQLTLPQAEGFAPWDDLDPMEDGVGELPPALDDENLAARVLCWIRIRLDEAGNEGEASKGWEARFSWAGINAVRLSQRVPVPGLRVGTGTGEPDQSLTLPNTPVLPDSVVLTVGGEIWTRVDDLLSSPPEVPVRDPSLPPGAAAPAAGDPRVYAVDRESGVVRFGTGYAGMRPPPGAPIVAAYAYGGGKAGNVGVGAIKTAPRLPAGFKPSNPVPTWGGDDGESVTEAERRIPLHLKHQDRAVSEEDFREIVPQTPGIALGRMEVMASYHPEIGSPAPGVITLLLIPDDPLRPEGPVPDRLFLQAVCRYLEPRRLLTTEVHLRGPDYVPLSISVGFDPIAGSDIAAVREEVKAALRRFLSPLVGGHPVRVNPFETAAPRGWPLETAVEDRELWAQVARVPGVSSVRAVRMWDGSGASIQSLPLSGLRLPRLDNISVRAGDAEDLTDVIRSGAGAGGAAGSGGAAGRRRRPVPVIPRSC